MAWQLQVFGLSNGNTTAWNSKGSYWNTSFYQTPFPIKRATWNVTLGNEKQIKIANILNLN